MELSRVVCMTANRCLWAGSNGRFMPNLVGAVCSEAQVFEVKSAWRIDIPDNLGVVIGKLSAEDSA